VKSLSKWFIILVLLVAGWVFWSYGYAWLNPRPRTLSTSLKNHPAVPVVRNLKLNEFTITKLRISDLGETAPISYKNQWSNDLTFEITWVEMFNKEAWYIEFSIPVRKLGTFSPEKQHAVIDIEIGAGGDLLVTTDRSERLSLISQQRSLEITDELNHPIILAELCAQRLPDDDPRREELFLGFEGWAIRSMQLKHTKWLLENPLPTSRCTQGWSLTDE